MALRPPDTKPVGCCFNASTSQEGTGGPGRHGACPRPPRWQWMGCGPSPGGWLRRQRGGQPRPGAHARGCGVDGVPWSCCRCVAVTVSSALRFAVSHHPSLCPLSLLHDLFFLLRSQACLPPGPDAPRAHEGISRQTWAPGSPWKRWPSGPGRPRGGAGTAWARGSGRALWTSRPQR